MKKPSLVILLLLGTLNAESKECSINSVLRNAINAEKLPESPMVHARIHRVR